jgi:2-methylisocitrate lyase-like PEP mutase family enzyme
LPRRAAPRPIFLIVARTDARTNHGLDEALRRGEAYAKAGADILFIESPESEEEMARIGRHFDVPLLANMADGGRTPILPKKRLEELGYKIAIFPATGFLPSPRHSSASTACSRTRARATRSHSRCIPSTSCALVGFEHVWEFDKRWSED